MLVTVVVLLALALAAAVGIVLTRGGSEGPQAQSIAQTECLPAGLQILADPSIAPALTAIVADLVEAGDGCAEISVQTEDSAVTAASLAAGTPPAFDIWVPESAMWPARAAGLAAVSGVDAQELVIGETVATTPVVFAASDATASDLGSKGAGYSSIVARSLTALMPDPLREGASSAALLALQTAVVGDATAFTALVLGFDAAATADTDAALAAAATATTPTVAVTTEQAVAQFVESSGGSLVPVYPTDVTAAVSVPFVTLADASDDTLGSVETLLTAIERADDRLAEFGWRDAAGTANADSTAEAIGAVGAVDPADAVNQAETLRTWQVLTAPSRMLALNDVSGSMNQPATAELRRIDLFEQAAVRAIESLSEDSSLAIWVFSSRRIGGQDWQELVPFGALGDPVHKQSTIDTANGLDSLVGGGTGLYDSVLAAVKFMRETYVPGQVNLVLLNTDGFNEDDEGLDLEGLLAELEALRDPSKPVAVVAVGYGPDTDQAALEQIAAATDGAAYQALQPTDIGTVLIEAVTQRGCRPNCG